MAGKDIGLTAEQYKAVVTIVDERLKEIRVTRKDFNELKAIIEQLAGSQQQLAKAQARTETRVEELAKAQARTERAMRNLAIQVGRLTDTVGYGLEDIARVVLPAYLKSHYNVRVEELERRFFEIKGRQVEINLYGEGVRNGEKVIVLGEAKSKIRERDVKRFVKNIDNLMPQVESKVFKVMFGYLIYPSAARLAEEQKVTLVASYQR